MTLPNPEYSKTLDTFYYNQQFKKYALQFMAIFSDLQVSEGVNNLNQQTNIITVPIKYGSADRVVQAIKSDNTQNKMLRLPMLAAKITGINIAVEKMHGTGTGDRHGYLPLGNTMPDGVRVIHRKTPIPYDIELELAIIASNTDQQFQILEQIFMLFDPILQIQTSDDAFDWTKINTVELLDINFEENYPSLNDKRLLVTNLRFTTTVLLSAPANIKANYIKKIQLRLDAIPTYEDTQAVAEDVDRLLPEYKKLFDIADYDIPEN